MSMQSAPSSPPTSATTTLPTTPVSTALPSLPVSAQVNPNWFAAAIQAVVYLARAEDAVCSSGAIADHMRSHPVFLRRVIATLCRAGLVEAREGRDGGYRLARPANQITLADLYRALKAADLAGGCATESASTRGPVLEPGVAVALDAVVAETEASMLDTLARHTVASVIAAADAAEGRH